MAGQARSPRGPRPEPKFATSGPRFVDSGDARIAFQVAGEGEESVLVLQPFWTETTEFLVDAHALLAPLVSKHRIIVHDRRGTAGSERHPTRITMDAMIDDLNAVLQSAGAESATVLALGEAGPLAVRFAANMPERVTRLVLIDPALRPMKGQGSSMLLHALRSRPKASLRALARTLVDNDESAAELGAQMAANVDGPTAARLYEAFLNADAVDVLDEVAAPTLLAFGVFDRIVSEAEARNLQSKMSNARVSLIDAVAGSEQALKQAHQTVSAFLTETATARPKATERRRLAPVPADAPAADAQRRAPRPRTQQPPAIAPVDYVPIVKQQRAKNAQPQQQQMMQPAMMPPGVIPSQMMQTQMMQTQMLGQHGTARPIMVAWGPPADIPKEAVEANRKGIDQLLIGEIEEALNSFQTAIELAPHYEDALVNHRELLTRLVQRRVAEWQTKQAEEAMADAERRAKQWAKRASRAGAFGRLLKPFGKTA
jgi:pimeloyl-ACP methyl ester carboxylesterase